MINQKHRFEDRPLVKLKKLSGFYGQFYSCAGFAFDLYLHKLRRADNIHPFAMKIISSQHHCLHRLIDCPCPNCLDFSMFVFTNNACNRASYRGSTGVCGNFNDVHGYSPCVEKEKLTSFINDCTKIGYTFQSIIKIDWICI